MATQLSTLGYVLDTCWWTRPEHLNDAFVVMPNHVHGIIINRWADRIVAVPKDPEADTFTVGATHASPLLGAIVGTYKSAVTRQTPGAAVWQQNYYEHIIRSEGAEPYPNIYPHQSLKLIRRCVLGWHVAIWPGGYTAATVPCYDKRMWQQRYF